jgi:hypothetical protein
MHGHTAEQDVRWKQHQRPQWADLSLQTAEDTLIV